MTNYKNFINNNEMLFNIDVYGVDYKDLYGELLTREAHEVDEFIINLLLAMSVYDFEAKDETKTENIHHAHIDICFQRELNPTYNVHIVLNLYPKILSVYKDYIVSEEYKETKEKRRCNTDFIFNNIEYDLYDGVLNEIYDIMEKWADDFL